MFFLLDCKPHGVWTIDISCAQCISNAEIVSSLVSSQENHEPGEAPKLKEWA